VFPRTALIEIEALDRQANRKKSSCSPVMGNAESLCERAGSGAAIYEIACSENPDTGAGNGHLFAWMRSAGTSTSVTPRKENKSFTRYFGGCSEVCFTM
jgi:hypothetical protein